MNQPKNHQASAVEQVFEQPKKHVWDPERAEKGDPIAIRLELERHVHMAIQANLHPIIASHMGVFPNEHSLFLDVDAGEGNLAGAVKNEFATRRVLAGEKQDLRRLEGHVADAKISQGHIQTLMHATHVDGMQPACIHLGGMAFTGNSRHRELILRWAMDTVHDNGIITMFMEDEDETDICSQAKIQNLTEVQKANHWSYVAQLAQREELGIRSCRVPVEMQVRGLSQQWFFAALQAVVPADKHAKLTAPLQMFRGFCEKQNAFRYNVRLVVLYSNPAMAPGSAPALPEVASHAPARVVGAQGVSRDAVSSVIAPVSAKEMPVVIDISRWLHGITHGSKHERHFKQFTRDWKAGDSAKKTEMEAAVRAELKECGAPKAEQDKYFEAVMKHFGAIAVVTLPQASVPLMRIETITPAEAQVIAQQPGTTFQVLGGRHASSVAGVQPVASSVPTASTMAEVVPSTFGRLELPSATAGQVAARMRELLQLLSDGHENMLYLPFVEAFDATGWTKDIWPILLEKLAALERASLETPVLDVLNGRTKPLTPAANAQGRVATDTPSVAVSMKAVAPKKTAKVLETLSEEEVTLMASMRAQLEAALPLKGAKRVDLRLHQRKAFTVLMRLWKKQGGTYATLEESMKCSISSYPSYHAYEKEWGKVPTADLAKEAVAPVLPEAPVPNPSGEPSAVSVQAAEEGVEGKFIESMPHLPSTVAAYVLKQLKVFQEKRGDGRHHYSAQEVECLGRILYAVREYGYGQSDVHVLTGVSQPTLVSSLHSVEALSAEEQSALGQLLQNLDRDLPRKGAARVDLNDYERANTVALLRLWRKLHGTTSSLQDNVAFALPSQATLSHLLGEHRGKATADLMSDMFPKPEVVPVEGEGVTEFTQEVTAVNPARSAAQEVVSDGHVDAVVPASPAEVVSASREFIPSVQTDSLPAQPADAKTHTAPDAAVEAPAKQVEPTVVSVEALQCLVEKQRVQIEQLMAQILQLQAGSSTAQIEEIKTLLLKMMPLTQVSPGVEFPEDAPGLVIQGPNGITTVRATTKGSVLIALLPPGLEVV